MLLIVLVYIVHSFDRGIVSVVLEPVRREFRLTDAQAGILGGLAYGIAYAVACAPIGLLVDRVNRRNLLATLLSIWSLMTLVGGLVQGFAALVACRAAVGAAESGGGPTSISLLTDLYGREERAGAFGLLYLGAGLGGAGAAALGAAIAQAHGWRAALLFAGVPGLLLAVALLVLVREPLRGAAEGAIADARPSAGETVRFLAGQRSLLWLYLGVPTGGIAMSVIAAWTIPFLIRTHGYSLESAGLLLGLMLASSVGFGAVASGYLSDWIGRGSAVRRLYFATACLAVAAPVGGLAYSVDDAAIALPLIFVAQALLASFLAPILGLVMNLSPPRMRGAAASTRDILANFVGYGIGPFLAGAISTAIGGPNALGRAIIITVVAGALIAALAFAMSARTIEGDLVRAGG